MKLSKEAILQVTENGLNVFRHYIPCAWSVNKPFFNPFYDDTKASCSIYADSVTNVFKIKDFGNMDYSGDCFDLVALILNKNCQNASDFTDILRVIDRDMGLGLSNGQQSLKNPMPIKQDKEKSTTNQVQSCPIGKSSLQEFSDQQLDWWKQFGITKEVLDCYNVVSIQQFESVNKQNKPYRIIGSRSEPIYGYVSAGSIKLYMPHSKNRFLYSGDIQKTYVFGLKQLPIRGDLLFITGGEKDVMALAAKGFNAICFNSETVNIPQKTIKRLVRQFKHIVLLYDSDETGKKAAYAQAKRLEHYDVRVLQLPLKGTKQEKDISDYFALGHSQADLMKLFRQLLDRIYEDTMLIMRSCKVDYRNPPAKPDPMISINKVTIGSPGNLLCVTGGEGSGKTNYLGGIISGCIADNDMVETLGTQIKRNTENKAVLVFDTEQSEDQLYKNLTYIVDRCDMETPPSWYHTYCLVGMARKERLLSIIQVMDRMYYEYGGIHMVVIDGIADLLEGVNDEQSSVGLVEELFRLAGIYKTCILSVLHLTPNGFKLRGHLGSELQRKAAGILSVEKDQETQNSFVKAIKVRDGSPLDVPLLELGWDKQLNRMVYLGEGDKSNQENRKLVELTRLVKGLFTQKSKYSYQELTTALMSELSIKDRTAKNYIKLLKDSNVLGKQEGYYGDYVLAE